MSRRGPLCVGSQRNRTRNADHNTLTEIFSSSNFSTRKIARMSILSIQVFASLHNRKADSDIHTCMQVSRFFGEYLLHTHTITQLHTHTLTHTLTHTHTHIHIYIYIYIYIYIFIMYIYHIHTHT